MRRFGRVVAAMAAFGFGYIAFLYLTLPDVRELRTKNLESTAFMRLRAREARAEGRELRRRASVGAVQPHLAALEARGARGGGRRILGP